MNELHLETPQVVATITQKADLDLISKGEGVAADILEFRLDDLTDHSATTKEILASSPLPSLVTVRSPEEGGAGKIALEDRIAMYLENIENADLIDTEIASLVTDEFSMLSKAAKKNDALLIGSYHNFDAFPGVEYLEDRVETAFKYGADIAKIAVYLDEMRDMFHLCELIEKIRSADLCISAMGMGPLGKLSRIVLAKAGSCLNYGYLQFENAPGQWSAEDLKRLIAEV